MKRPGGFDDAPDSSSRSHPASAPVPVPLPLPVPDVPSDPPSERPSELPSDPPAARPRPSAAAPSDPVRSAERELRRARRSVRRREVRERRRFTEHLRRRRRNWLIVGGAVLGLALFVAIGVLSPLTAVREVRISGASQVPVDDLQAALARFDGVPLALVGDDEVHRALEPFPLIQRYSIERIPPHTLIVRLEERDAVIAVAGDGGFELFDPAGVLVGATSERPVGVPLAGGQAAVPASPAFEAAGHIVRDLPRDLRDQLAQVDATSAQDVSFVLDGGTRVVWGEAAETQRKALVLRSMLAAVGAVATIDVSSPTAPVFQ